MRLAAEAWPFGPHPLLELGVDQLRPLAPVRPGDVIRIEGEVLLPHEANDRDGAGKMDAFTTTAAPPSTRSP